MTIAKLNFATDATGCVKITHGPNYPSAAGLAKLTGLKDLIRPVMLVGNERASAGQYPRVVQTTRVAALGRELDSAGQQYAQDAQ